MTGLHGWWYGDNIATDVSGVTGWPDNSGNGFTLADVNLAKRPTIASAVLNSHSALQFTGDSVTHGVANSSLLTGLTAGEVFILVKMLDTVNFVGFWGWPEADNPTAYPFSGSVYDGCMTTARKGGFSAGITLTNWHCYNVTSAAGEWTARENFSQVFTTATNTFNTGTATLGDSTGSFPAAMQVAELLLYDHKLTTGDRADVRSYLNTKYALSL